MKREVTIPKGWRRGNSAKSPAVKAIAPTETPIEIKQKEIVNDVQPETKTEEREHQKSRKGKKEKVFLLYKVSERILRKAKVFSIEELEIIKENKAIMKIGKFTPLGI